MEGIINSLMSPSEFEKVSIRRSCGYNGKYDLVVDPRLSYLVLEIYKHTFPLYRTERLRERERRQRTLDSMFGMD